MKPFTALKKFSTLYFTLIFLLININHSFHFICYTYLQLASLSFLILLALNSTDLFSLSYNSFWKYALCRGKTISPTQFALSSQSWAHSQRRISRCFFFVFWLWFSNIDEPYLISLLPVSYLLSLSMPSHR